MKKICIIIPYFGKLPKNIITYLISCKKNTNINWLIFTNDLLYNKLNKICKNVTFIKSSMTDMKKRLIKATGMNNIVLDKPYKLCDYKPLYGKMFSDYLTGYDYWGYSDIDIVYGDLWKYIRYGVIHNYEKIGELGHFTLMHNDNITNNRYKLPIIRNGKKIYLFRDIISKTSKGLAFDEGSGIDIIYRQYHLSTYVNPHLVNDIIFPNLDLNTCNKGLYRCNQQCYIWNNGHDDFYYKSKDNNIHKIEYGYFHFQKRRVFKNYLFGLNNKLFSITTHGYNKMDKLTTTTIRIAMKQNKSPFKDRLVYKIRSYCLTPWFATRMRVGNIYLPIKYILKNILKRNFIIFKI